MNTTLVSGSRVGRLLDISSDSDSNTFCWNNFTQTSGLYVKDLNGGNFYNSSACDGEGNIWTNVINGSVQVTGVNNSSISGLYIGHSGTGYPYNNTNAQGKLSGNVVDYAPLTTKPTKTYRLTLSASPSNGGNVSGAGTNILDGTFRNITATPNQDVRFIGWKRNSGSCTITNNTSQTTSVLMLSNCSLSALFNLSNILTLSTYPYSNLGGNAYGAGIGIPSGTYRNISAVPKPGYKFRVWDVLSYTGQRCVITNRMAANTTVLILGENCGLQAGFGNATRTHLNVTVTPANAGNVRITPDPYGSPSGPTLGFEYGENPRINATPAFGYTFVNWTRISGDCDVFHVPCSGINCTTNPNSIVGMHFTDCRLEARFRYSTTAAPISVVKR